MILEAVAAMAVLAGAEPLERPEPPFLAVRLSDAETQALAHSPILKQAESDLAGAEAQAESQFSQLLPRVTLDGFYGYQTLVPKVTLGPTSFQFGDANSFSIGPTLTYTLFDRGSLVESWKGLRAAARSKQAQKELIRRQVLLMTRLDYFQVQLALEQERSLIDSLRLAEAQYSDINNRFRAGSASRIDWLSAHEQVLDRRRDLRSAQAEVASSLRTLFAQTGQEQGAKAAAPMDSRVERPWPKGFESPSVRVELDPLELVEKDLERATAAQADQDYPQLLIYRDQAEAGRARAKSVEAGRWPAVRLSFKSDYFFPNTPLIESAWQNMVVVSASVPLFEYGKTERDAAVQRSAAESAEHLRDEAFDELERDWTKARDQFAALRDQEAIDRESVAETAEIALLRYGSYRDGGSTILDVETANLNAVLARVTAARTQAEALIQLATLDSLSASKEGTP